MLNPRSPITDEVPFGVYPSEITGGMVRQASQVIAAAVQLWNKTVKAG